MWSQGLAVRINGSQLSASSGNITITGTGYTENINDYDYGVYLYNGSNLVTTGSGNILITGTGGAGNSSDNFGVYDYGTGTGTISPPLQAISLSLATVVVAAALVIGILGFILCLTIASRVPLGISL